MSQAKAMVIPFFAFLIAFCVASETHAFILPEFSIDQPTDSINAYSQMYPTVAFNGSVYVAAWQDDAPPLFSAIRLQRFDTAGHPLGPMETLPTSTNAYGPKIASNGHEFVIICTQNAPGGGVETAAARLDQNGNLIPNSTVTASGMGYFPGIASNGTDYIVFSTDDNPVCRRLTALGFGPLQFLAGSNLNIELSI
jgi:hypothetical protein